MSGTEVLIPVELAAQGVSGRWTRALDGRSLRGVGTLRGDVIRFSTSRKGTTLIAEPQR